LSRLRVPTPGLGSAGNRLQRPVVFDRIRPDSFILYYSDGRWSNEQPSGVYDYTTIGLRRPGCKPPNQSLTPADPAPENRPIVQKPYEKVGESKKFKPTRTLHNVSLKSHSNLQHYVDKADIKTKTRSP